VNVTPPFRADRAYLRQLFQVGGLEPAAYASNGAMALLRNGQLF
jgi:hypothetical protein